MPGAITGTCSRACRRAAALVVAIASASLLVAVPAASAVSDHAAIANLNAQRSANGIPAGITVDSNLSQGCAAHNGYGNSNNVVSHDESPALPGYTPLGDATGRQSLVARNAPPWNTPAENPFEAAPIHLAQVLDPSLQVSGFDEALGFTCLTVAALPRRTPPAQPQLFTYPGPGTRIYGGEKAGGDPYTPGELIGIPEGAVTGPHLYVFVFGPGDLETSRIASATLRGKARKGEKPRKVKVKKIDGTNQQLGQFTPPGGIVIPVKPLRPGKYSAAVTVLAAGQRLKRRWSFIAH